MKKILGCSMFAAVLTCIVLLPATSHAAASAQCVNAYKELEKHNAVKYVATLLKTDCAVMYRHHWRKGKGVRNVQVCAPAWNGLNSTKAVGAAGLLVRKDCPVIYEKGWRTK